MFTDDKDQLWGGLTKRDGDRAQQMANRAGRSPVGWPSSRHRRFLIAADNPAKRMIVMMADKHGARRLAPGASVDAVQYYAGYLSPLCVHGNFDDCGRESSPGKCKVVERCDAQGLVGWYGYRNPPLFICRRPEMSARRRKRPVRSPTRCMVLKVTRSR